MYSKSYIPRSIETYAFDEALTARHMIFLAGPRQVGKTMLARHWLEKKRCSPLYFDWDDPATRRAYQRDSRFFESSARSLGIRSPWIVFDEIHKRTGWRDILKGAHDIFADTFRFLVTGSARLDLMRRGGDSLVGRYNLFHMMPLTVAEAARNRPVPAFLADRSPRRMSEKFEERISRPPAKEVSESFELLMRHGPFPEPFLRQNDRFSRKWHEDYISLVIRQDLKDLTRVVEIDKIENLLYLLPSRIMSPLSMANLAREVEAAHTTVKSWLEQLKRLYLVFPVSPWSGKISRGLKREKKWYFLDWTYAPEGAARLENMVATCLLGACRKMTDMGYGSYRLGYVRTLDKREIDFIIHVDGKPVAAVEVKSGDVVPTGPLRRRRDWLGAAPTLGIQAVNRRGVLQKHPDGTWVVSVERFLAVL